MIALQITARSYEIDSELEKYIQKKLGRLDRYLPKKHQPKGMRVELFKDPSGKEDNRYRVTAILEVAGPDIVAETAAMNPHAAIDIIEAKLKVQIRRYKDKYSNRHIKSLKSILSRDQ